MKTLEQKLKTYADENETRRTTLDTKMQKEDWKEFNLKNPYTIVRQFVIDKGLKLYGGQALHEHLEKHGKGLYTKNQFPDYDVFSPDAWNHAKELSDKLYELGYSFVEAKSSVLNDEHHQTYKVSVDMIPMLDLTQVGCPAKELKDNKCSVCSIKDNKGKCMSIFNEIPAIDISQSPDKYEIYNRTYDYETDKNIYKNKMFVASPDWLKISMYKELIEPINYPERIPKVGKRLEIFNKYFETQFMACSKQDRQESINDTKIQSIIDYIGDYTKGKELIHVGATAHNFFIKNVAKLQEIPINTYIVYTINDASAYKLEEKLKKKFNKDTFKIHKRQLYWKGRYDDETVISVKNAKGKYYTLITFIELSLCAPYLKVNGYRYATMDTLKYRYYMGKAIPELLKLTEQQPHNYGCLLKDLLTAERRNKRKTKKNPTKSKFRRLVSRCQGDEVDPRMESMETRWSAKLKTLKKTKYYIDNPKKGFITKVYPMENTQKHMPYKPEEKIYKTYIYKDKYAVDDAWRASNNKNNKKAENIASS